ncbi:MAG: hypothetical protein M3Z75_32985 [Actinomycetota bacterium]|nr:hypothetical protein [Actinomycetota bacterium]
MSAPQSREGRLIQGALRCYPVRWQRRHAAEAAELAALLIADGTRPASIVGSYLAGAAREWLTPPPGRSRSTVAAALLAVTCLLGFSAALVAGTAPAKAGTTQARSGPVSVKIKPVPPNAGSPRPITACRPVLTRPATGASPAAGYSQRNLQGSAHARSC